MRGRQSYEKITFFSAFHILCGLTYIVGYNDVVCYNSKRQAFPCCLVYPSSLQKPGPTCMTQSLECCKQDWWKVLCPQPGMRGDIYGDYSLHPLHGGAGCGDTGNEGKCTVTSTSTDQPFLKGRFIN